MKLYVLVKIWTDGSHEPGVQTALATSEQTACMELMELAYHPDDEEPKVEYLKLDEKLKSDPWALAWHLSQIQADDGRAFYVEAHLLP